MQYLENALNFRKYRLHKGDMSEECISYLKSYPIGLCIYMNQISLIVYSRDPRRYIYIYIYVEIFWSKYN